MYVLNQLRTYDGYGITIPLTLFTSLKREREGGSDKAVQPCRIERVMRQHLAYELTGSNTSRSRVSPTKPVRDI